MTEKLDFNQIAALGGFLSRDYARDLLSLLVNYTDISASEAASRLDLHIRTVQDSLELLAQLEILGKEEVFEKKRPYFRYSLKEKKVEFHLDFSRLFKKAHSPEALNFKIKERKKSGARFTSTRDNRAISSVITWTGKGRQQKERKLNLTRTQGEFFLHLPFPTAQGLSIAEIMDKAGVDKSRYGEILDMVELLVEYKVIEKKPG